MFAPLLLLALPALRASQMPISPAPSPLSPIQEPLKRKESSDLRAKYLITAADDFIVDVYLNGRCVPASKREMLNEIFGATVERINVEVKRGDWIVFNVVNNRLRWGGVSYFGVAGCFAPNEFGFVSDVNNGLWAACDSPKDAENFIAWREALMHRPAQLISLPWARGDELMHSAAGDKWNGTSVWGTSRNTWVKVLIE